MDGVYLEYCYGDPTPFAIGLAGDGSLRFSFPRNLAAADVILEIQLSDDLVTWTATSSALLVPASHNGGGIQTESWAIEPGEALRKFVRLAVRSR
jgi:hypothetical protein